VISLEGYNRYAVFWTPPAGSGLALFGAEWLGWDAEAARDAPQPALILPRPLAEVTRTPRRYGFHGTLKPPFRLAIGTHTAEIDQALTTLAGRLPPASAPGLALTTRLGFLALMPDGPAPEISLLAATCTRDLDRFRAPPGEAELAQRRARALTPRQEQNLTHWGYPYVLDDFHFHLTLTGRLHPGEAEALTVAATARATPHLDPALRLNCICLFGDPGGGQGFRLLRRYRLIGKTG
jgi:putative phosphonate metabolism protein